jgi:hypothetical protein
MTTATYIKSGAQAWNEAGTIPWGNVPGGLVGVPVVTGDGVSTGKLPNGVVIESPRWPKNGKNFSVSTKYLEVVDSGGGGDPEPEPDDLEYSVDLTVEVEGYEPDTKTVTGSLKKI